MDEVWQLYAEYHADYSDVAVYGNLYSKQQQASPTAFTKMLVYSALYNVNERRAFA